MMDGFGEMGGGWFGLHMGLGVLMPITLVVLVLVGVMYLMRGRNGRGPVDPPR